MPTITTLLADRVLALIRERDHVTFAELAREFPDDFANGEIALEVHDNLVIWTGMQATGAAAFKALREGGKVTMQPTQTLTYLIDGTTLRFPIAKRARAYAKPHWLPVVVRPVAPGPE
jgi:hypothetical protein